MMTLDDYHKITRLEKVNGEWKVKEADMIFERANDTQLDRWGRIYGIERGPGETNRQLRTRITEFLLEPDPIESLYGSIDIVLPGAVHNIEINGTISYPQKTTLTIYYDNGLPFTAKNTINHSKSDTELRYTIECEDRGVKSSTDYAVPLHGVMAIVYKQGDKVWVDKLKPCASVKIDVVKV